MPRHPPCALISLTYSRIMSCFSTEELFEIVFYPLNFFNWISLISSLLFRYSIFKEHLSLSDIWSHQVLFGGDEENRTPDPLLARQVLSQLSYIPRPHKMGSSGLEPPTSRLSGVRSNQLSYEPIGLRRPSTLPGSCPPSTIDRLGLNRRVRNGNGCVP